MKKHFKQNLTDVAEARDSLRATVTAITPSLKKNWWLIALYLVFEVSGAAVGSFLSGSGSFWFAIAIDVVTTIIGFYGLTKVVRETTRYT
jgi:hypothetical protein